MNASNLHRAPGRDHARLGQPEGVFADDATVTRQTIDWGFGQDSVVVEAVREGLAGMGVRAADGGGD